MSHFDQQAAGWDEAPKVKMMRELAQATINNLRFECKKLDIMDFGCGTGLFGMEFLPYAKNLVGVDTSAGMLGEFAKKVEENSACSKKSVGSLWLRQFPKSMV